MAKSLRGRASRNADAEAAARQHLSDDESHELSNSALRADTIRAAVRWLADKQAEVKAINAEINEYRSKHIKGDLGMKIADFNAVYRVSQLEVDDRDALLDTIREGFAALGIGESVDWVSAAGEPNGATPPKRGRGRPRKSEQPAPDMEAQQHGKDDALLGNQDHAARYPAGEPGHADYHLGRAEGERERHVDGAGRPAEQPGVTAH